MKNSTLLMAALMAVTASAVKAQALNTTLKQKLGEKHASVVMKPNAPAIYTLPGTKSLTTYVLLTTTSLPLAAPPPCSA